MSYHRVILLCDPLFFFLFFSLFFFRNKVVLGAGDRILQGGSVSDNVISSPKAPEAFPKPPEAKSDEPTAIARDTPSKEGASDHFHAESEFNANGCTYFQ